MFDDEEVKEKQKVFTELYDKKTVAFLEKCRYRSPSTLVVLMLFAAATLSLPVVADAIRSTQIPSVVKRLTEKYGGSALSERSAPSVVIQKDPLGHLVALQRQHWPQAWVSGTFYDWRTLSRYRRTAGLHLGYDIALPFGTAVSAGWDGTVTDIVPWGGAEYGVTVVDAAGVAVTYGHVTPLVAVGQRIKSGAIIARIAADHVDVKMRDASGQYVPFGEGSSANSTVVSTTPAIVDRKALLTAWLVAKTSADQAEEELFLRENAAQKYLIEERSAQRTVTVLEGTLKELALPENKGLVARKKLEEFKAELAEAKTTLARLKISTKNSSAELKRQAQLHRTNLKAFEDWAKSEGLRWSDVENLVASTIVSDDKLKSKVEKEKKEKSSALQVSLEELKSRRDKGRNQLARLEDLYASGGMSQQEITDERLRQELLEEEYQLRISRSR